MLSINRDVAICVRPISVAHLSYIHHTIHKTMFYRTTIATDQLVIAKRLPKRSYSCENIYELSCYIRWQMFNSRHFHKLKDNYTITCFYIPHHLIIVDSSLVEFGGSLVSRILFFIKQIQTWRIAANRQTPRPMFTEHFLFKLVITISPIR